MRSEDLSIQLELLPGVVRRRWIEKKRKMQHIANQSFAGMEIVNANDEEHAQKGKISDWMLPSSRFDVFKSMEGGDTTRQVSIYDVPPNQLTAEVSRAQLQR